MSVSEPTTDRSTPSASGGASPAGSALSRKQRTRQRLLDAGLSLFAAHGPRAVTSHAIAAEAGFASGTFYLHFKDKLELFAELAEEAANEVEARLLAVTSNKTEPEDIGYALADALVGFAHERRDLLRIVFHPESESSEVATRVLGRLADGVSLRRREAIASGLAQDMIHPDVLAQAVVGMWAHVLAWWTEDPRRATREDLVQTLTHIHLHGCVRR